MQQTTKYTKYLTVITLAIIMAMMNSCAKQSGQLAGKEIIDMIPADSLFCVHAMKIQDTAAAFDAYLAETSPDIPKLAHEFPKLLTDLLNTPDHAGIDMNGTFAIFMTCSPGEGEVANPMANMFFGALVPVTDYQQFIGGITNCSDTAENGIATIASKHDKKLLVTQVSNYALITQAGNTAKLLSTVEAMTDKAVGGLDTVIGAAEVNTIARQPVWIYVNIQGINKTFGPMLLGGLEAAKMAFEKASQANPTSPPMVANMLDMYISFLREFMNQTQSLTYAVTPSADLMSLSIKVKALADTKMAEILAITTKAGQNSLIKYLPNGAMMNVAGNINPDLWKIGYAFSYDVIEAIGGEITPEDRIKIDDITARFLESITGEVAMSLQFSPDQKEDGQDQKASKGLPFKCNYILSVADQAEFNKAMAESIEMANAGLYNDLYGGMGMVIAMEVNTAAFTYKGVSIDSATLNMTPEPGTPNSEMITAMYGQGFEYRWGCTDGVFLCSVGTDADSEIKELIDLAKAGGYKDIASEMKMAMDITTDPDSAELIGTFNCVRMLQMVTNMVANVMPDLPKPSPIDDLKSKSNMAFAAHIANGAMTFEIAMPKAHLNEIIKAAKQMAAPAKPIIDPENPNPQAATVNTQMITIKKAIRSFTLDCGRYPTQDEQFKCLLNKPKNVKEELWKGPYLTIDQRIDPWGKSYIYFQGGEKTPSIYYIVTYGADNRPGGIGDNADVQSDLKSVAD